MLLPLGVRTPDRVAIDCFLDAQALLRVEAALRQTVFVLSGDGTVEVGERIQVLDRRVCPERDRTAHPQVRFKRVRLSLDLGSDPPFHSVDVGPQKNRLIIDNDVPVRHPTKQCMVGDLAMDQAVAQRVGRIRKILFINGEHLLDRSVADRVGHHRDAQLGRGLTPACRFLPAHHFDPKVLRIIQIGLRHHRRSPAERTILEQLERSQCVPVTLKGRIRAIFAHMRPQGLRIRKLT